MAAVMGFVLEVLQNSLIILNEAALYILAGMLVAGVLHEFLSAETIAKYTGERSIKSVVMATVLGAPLPLCSCGVVPTVVALKRKGARRESLISFLISTPETGVDSIAISYALLGPIMAVFRPLAAVLTALVAGGTLMASASEEKEEPTDAELKGLIAEFEEEHDHGHDAADACCEAEAPRAPTAAAPPGRVRGWARALGAPFGEDRRLGRILGFAAKDLTDDITFWLIVGVLVAGLITTVLPEDFLGRYLGSGLFSMLVAAAIGIPLYVCASASTPMAAAFMAKGLNPGAALVFLLTGPATNAATITIITRFFGARFVRVYLFSILAVGVSMGLLLNQLLAVTGWTVTPVVEPISTTTAGGLAKIFGTTVLALLMIRSLARTGVREAVGELTRNVAWAFGGRGAGGVRAALVALRPRLGRYARVAAAAAASVYAVSGVFTVAPGEVAFVKRFGAVRGEARGPGLHFAFPAPIDRVDVFAADAARRVDVGFRTREIAPEPGVAPGTGLWQSCYASQENRPEESGMLTGDENLIEAKFTVHYRVSDPYAHYYRFGANAELVRAMAEGAMREAVARRDAETILTAARREIAADAEGRLQGALDRYGAGARVLFLDIVDLHPPEQGIDSFRDVSSAREDKQARIEKARSYRNGTIPQARGEAAKVVKGAEDYRASLVSEAEGRAGAFNQQYEQYRRAPEVTRARLLLETMERALPAAEKYIVDADDRPPEFWLDGAAPPELR